MKMRLLPLLLPCGLAACTIEVRISDVRAERTDSGEVVVRFEADHDLENQGLSVLGYFQLGRDAGNQRPERATCHASLEPLPKTSPAKFGYLCRIPARADREGELPEARRGGNYGLVYVNSPYDLTVPDDHRFDFYVMGGGCGCRGLNSNSVPLIARKP